MNLIALWPTQFRHCYENPKGLVAVQATKFHSPARPQATRPRRARIWGPFPLRTDTSAPLGLSPALSSALRGPPQDRHHQVGANTFFFPGAPGVDTSQPPSLPAGGALSRLGNSNPGRGGRKRSPCWCCSTARLPALRWPPPLFPAPTRPLRACAVPRRGAGLRFLSAAAAVAAATVSFRWGEARNGPVGSPPPFPRPEPPLLVRRDLVPVEFSFHPAAVSSVLGPVEVTALEEEAAAAALASPPPVRCPRSRRGGAAATAAPPPPAALGPGWVELRCPRTSSHCSART